MMDSTKQLPSETDSIIMASALLAIGRNTDSTEAPSYNNNNTTSKQESHQNDCSAHDPLSTVGNVLPVPVSLPQEIDGYKSLQLQQALQQVVANAQTNVMLNQYLAGCAYTKPVESSFSHLSQIHKQVKAPSLFNQTFLTPGLQYAGPSSISQVSTENLNLIRDQNCVAEEQSLIRQKEIEKALHSKPQRGRKRANLNEVERMELTRTRNREHAKSTRIRKKQRYEQLLACEAKVQTIEKQEELDYRRRCWVADFLAFREGMIQQRTASPASHDADLEDKFKMMFQGKVTIIYDDGLVHKNKNDHIIDRMKAFDTSVLSKIGGDNTTSASVSYKVRNSSDLDSIATTKSGTALVDVDIVNEIGPSHCKTLSFLLKVVFEPESDKVQSISIAVLNPTRGIRNVVSFDQPCSIQMVHHKLEEQISHPSVVSLDVVKDHRRDIDETDEKRCEIDDGIDPVMTF